MSQPSVAQEHSRHLLQQVYEGMDVCDPDGHKIGTVECVYAGTPERETGEEGAKPRRLVPPARHEPSLIEDFARAMAPMDRLPGELRRRLLDQGFIRIDCTGLFAADRYATPEQIASVSADRATLRVPRKALLKR